MNFNTLEKLNKKLILSIFLVSVIVFCNGFTGVGRFWYNLTSKNIELVQETYFPVDTYNNKYVQLPDDRIACIGAQEYRDGKDVYIVQIYNPETNKTDIVGELKNEKQINGYNAIALKDGKILITGGGGTNRAEIFNPDTSESIIVSGMNYPRINHSMFLLNDGRVLITRGDYYIKETGEHKVSPAEIYDPGTKKFTVLSEPSYQRIYPIIQINDNELFVSILKYKDKVIEYENIDLKKTKMVVDSAKKAIYDVKENKYKIIFEVKEYASPITLSNDHKFIYFYSKHLNDDFFHIGIFDLKTNNFQRFKNILDKKDKVHRYHREVILSKNGNILILCGHRMGLLGSNIPVNDVQVFYPDSKKFKKIGETLKHNWVLASFRIKNSNIAIIDLKRTGEKKIYIYNIEDGGKN